VSTKVWEVQTIAIRIISRKYLSKVKTTEYRYEVIESTDANFKDIDFATSEVHLSRNHCYEVQLNEVRNNPRFEEILCELKAEDYKYSN